MHFVRYKKKIKKIIRLSTKDNIDHIYMYLVFKCKSMINLGEFLFFVSRWRFVLKLKPSELKLPHVEHFLIIGYSKNFMDIIQTLTGLFHRVLSCGFCMYECFFFSESLI